MSTLPGFTAPPVWEFPKHGGRIVAGERVFKGKRFFELRLWTGEQAMTATGKGVTLPPEAVASLAEALATYAAALGSDEPVNGS